MWYVFNIYICPFIFRAFLDKSVDRETKIKLLQKACEVHVKMYKDAMNGKGIDRHLFALYVVSKGLDYVSFPYLLYNINTANFTPFFYYQITPPRISLLTKFVPALHCTHANHYVSIRPTFVKCTQKNMCFLFVIKFVSSWPRNE